MKSGRGSPGSARARGGFYSYTFLENLAGAQISNAASVITDWQAIRVGDTVRLAPEVGMTAAAVSPDRALVLRGGIPMGPVAAPYDFTWAFVIEEAQDETVRVLVRERYRYTRRWAALIVQPVQWVSFVMSERMLRGIRDRVEHTPRIMRPPVTPLAA